MSEIDLKQTLLKGVLDTSKITTINTLGYIKAGFETFKKMEIPVFNEEGEIHSLKRPYYAEGMREFVDFMIIFLDESIKQLQREEKDNG